MARCSLLYSWTTSLPRGLVHSTRRRNVGLKTSAGYITFGIQPFLNRGSCSSAGSLDLRPVTRDNLRPSINSETSSHRRTHTQAVLCCLPSVAYHPFQSGLPILCQPRSDTRPDQTIQAPPDMMETLDQNIEANHTSTREDS